MKYLLMLLGLASPVFATQAPYVEIFKPQNGQLLLGVDRTATNWGEDVAHGLSATPQVDLRWLGTYSFSGLFAGGKVTLAVTSYQMWLLTHPQAHRKDIPENTEKMAAKFELRFLKGAQLLSTQTVVADQVLARQESDYCFKCEDHSNPAYAILGSAQADIPSDATDVHAVLLKVVDLDGVESSPIAFAQNFPIYYHADPNPIHVQGKAPLNPLDTNVSQFRVMESGRLKSGSAVQIEADGFFSSRSWAFIFGNTPVRAAYEKTPVCYDRMNPSRAHFSNGNDIDLDKKTLFYRVDRGQWQKAELSAKRMFEIPAVKGALLELAFEYTFSNNLEKGLFDINRCYQISSSFEWVPVQPGVKSVPLGTFYDSPTGNLTQGWEIQLEP